MTEETIVNLKKDLDTVKIKTFEKKKVLNKKDKQSIEFEIQDLTNRMIEKYELLKYDLGIKMESHKTKFFICDVEDIIRIQENEEGKQ